MITVTDKGKCSFFYENSEALILDAESLVGLHYFILEDFEQAMVHYGGIDNIPDEVDDILTMGDIVVVHEDINNEPKYMVADEAYCQTKAAVLSLHGECAELDRV